MSAHHTKYRERHGDMGSGKEGAPATLHRRVDEGGADGGRALCRQEYTMLGRDGRVLGWPATGIPQPNGSYYCGVGQEAVSAPKSPAYVYSCVEEAGG